MFQEIFSKMNSLTIWDADSISAQPKEISLPTRLARRQLHQFQDHIDKIRLQIETDWKTKIVDENNLALLLFMMQDFTETLLQCQEEHQKSPLLHNFHIPYQDIVKKKTKLIETEEKFKALCSIPATALSNTSNSLANIKLLQQLTKMIEISNDILKDQPEDIKALKIVLLNQQLLLWNLTQHISTLIATSQIRP